MASPVVTPPRRPQSLFGPIVLISLGVVFLLVHLGVWSYRGVGIAFARYWPVLLILWGLAKLLEYMDAQRKGVPAPGIGWGGGFLLFFIIVFGMAATGAVRVNWDEVRNEMGHSDVDDPFGFLGRRYEFTEEVAPVKIPEGQPVKVITTRGDVTVETSADDQVHMRWVKMFRATEQSQADQRNQETKAEIANGNNETVINVAGGRFENGIYELTLQVPAKSPVQVTTSRGDVVVRQRTANLQIETTNGDVLAEDIQGTVRVQARRGDIHVRDVKGDVTVSGRAGDLIASDISGAANLEGEFTGTINVARIGKGVRFKSNRTDMEFGKLDGEMVMESGDLRMTSVAGPVRLMTRSKDIRLEDYSGDVKIGNSNSDIELRPKSLGNIDVENDRGSIELVLPETAAFNLNARSENGEINSEFPGLNVSNSHRLATATGQVGSGGPTIRLSMDRGSINIRR
jgi:DUF4097 and DUF4098 domain-containing protein YvlB